MSEMDLQFVKSYLTFKEIDPTLQKDKLQIIKEMKSLPTIDCLYILARMEHYLWKGDLTDISTQKKLIDFIFKDTEKNRILTSILMKDNYSIIFHPQQIYLCMSMLLRYGNIEKTGKVSDNLLNILGIILIHINELCQEGKKLDMYSISQQKREMAGTLWQIGNLYSMFNVNLGSEMARSYIVFTKGREGKHLSEAFKKATGIDLVAFWTVVFALFSNWNGSLSEFITSQEVLDKDKYFSSVHLESSEIDKVINLLSCNIRTLSDICQSRIDSFKHEAFNFEWLKEKPLLEFEPGRFICLSLFYLIHRITNGMSELLRTSMGYESYNVEIGSSYLGNAYNNYVRSVLNQTYFSAPAERVYHRKFRNIEITDGIIDYGDSLICLEVKAGNIQKKYRLGNSYQDIKLGLKPFLITSGAVQLDKRISEFKEGKVKIKEIDPQRIKRYYPVLIMCTWSIPQFSILTEQYYQILKNENILNQRDIAPLTILDLQEFEIIMELVKEGKSLVDLIEDKTRNPLTEQWSYLNFITTRINEAQRSEYINKQLKELLDKLVTELGFDNLKKKNN